MRQLSLLLPHLHSTATRYYARVSMPLKTQAKSSLSNYDLEDLLPRWLQTAYTTSHIQSALTTLDEREDARVHFRAESIEAVRSKNANQHLSVDAVQPGGAGKIKAKSKAAAEAISSHLHSSDSTFDSLESINFYSIASGALPVNQQRNRYMDVLPYDRTRVKIKVPHLGGNPGSVHNHLSGDDESEGLYLNANWVQEKYGKKWWIASQAPLRNTAYTFLSLLLEDMYPPSLSHSATSTSSNPSVPASKSHIDESHHSRPRTVVQLTQNVESGGRKAHPYFPDVVGQTMIIVPDITDYPSSSPASTSASQLSSSKLKVTLVAQEEIREACCVKSIVEVRPFLDAVVDDEDSDRDSDDLPLRPRPSSSSPPIPSSSIADSDSDSDHYGDSYDSSSSSSIHRKPKSSRSKTYPAIRFTHLLFVAWPDHSVPSPSDRAALFEFVRLVDRVNRQMPFDDSVSGPSQTTHIRPGETPSKDAEDKMKITSKEFKVASQDRTGGSAEEKDVDVDPPIIVGCSAGIGRTGSFIAMNSLLRHAGFLPPPGDLQHPSSSSPLPSPLPSPQPPPPTQSSQTTSFPTSTSSSTTPTSTTTPPLDAPATIYNSHTPVVGPLGPLPTSLSADLVSQEIDSLREQRAGMVQRPEQAVLVYEMMVGAYVERGELKR